MSDHKERFVQWLDQRVTNAGLGTEEIRSAVDPSGVFWLGRLAPEQDAMAETHRERRMDPCSVGMRVKPATDGPWTFDVRVRARGWNRITAASNDLDTPEEWHKSELADVPIRVEAEPGMSSFDFGVDELTFAFRSAGIGVATAAVQVSDESWRGSPELVVTVVNTTPESAHPKGERYLFEVELVVEGLATAPFVLESLPDSFRYERELPAIGINCGVEVRQGKLATRDTIVVSTKRPTFRFGYTAEDKLDLSFSGLTDDPLPRLRQLVDGYARWGREAWSPDALARRQSGGPSWSPEMIAEAERGREAYEAELDRLRRGVAALESSPQLLRAYRLMNKAMGKTAMRRDITSWRPFQVGFLLGVLPSLVEGRRDWNTVEIVWFATGGGKTETYLGLLVLAVFYDRLRGKHSGITAWSRFPLRLLSLQQTQRFADALGSAELVRREHRVPGDPIALGYYVGRSSTPNDIPVEPTKDNPIDVEDDTMPARFNVLLRCPFCAARGVSTRFNRRHWRLEHFCSSPSCPSAGEALPLFVVDSEIYRFMPSVVIGTLDKAALISMQAAMRGFVHGPAGRCRRPGHGFTYAKRGSRPSGCLVPGCKEPNDVIKAHDRAMFAPSFRLQDELHLLRDSLGAVDSHYESILDDLQIKNTDTDPPKIIASSATLAGYERQTETLYGRTGRVFPALGPSVHESYWSASTTKTLRRYVAVWPRGVTLEWVSDRTITVLQQSVRRLRTEAEVVCAQAGIDPVHADELLNLYGTNVIYGNTVKDVEAARRSMGSQVPIDPLNTVSLTGQTPFDDVRTAIAELDGPPAEFDERVHVVAASSMFSHGVDIDRLNIMTVLGVPLTTAEFIQTTARVGRTHPGLVYVVHKIGRERDAGVYSHFQAFVEHGDRLVEPIPVTRSSRRVLDLTSAAAIEARRLFFHEPRSEKLKLTTTDLLRDHHRTVVTTVDDETKALREMLGIRDDEHLLDADLRRAVEIYFTKLNDLGSGARWPADILHRRPMTSLRDVETQIPISDD
ncbi:helicase-related protein [Dactylosporangium sp. CA-139114]|uniref:helicase-related protein n=1 Tax=Dactylosporangium sp. CA-139114 TaxID=3239931 RepID=UPI003D955062